MLITKKGVLLLNRDITKKSSRWQCCLKYLTLSFDLCAQESYFEILVCEVLKYLWTFMLSTEQQLDSEDK